MKHIITLLLSLSLVLVYNCKSDKNNTESKSVVQKTEAKSISAKTNTVNSSVNELSQFQKIYESRINQHKFGDSAAAQIKIYSVSCTDNCLYAPFNNRTSEGQTLTNQQFNELLEILQSPRSYNQKAEMCFNPDFSIVLYDKQNVPKEFINVSMSCNNFQTYPTMLLVRYNNEFKNGFSVKTRAEFRRLFKKWKINIDPIKNQYDESKDKKSSIAKAEIK